jgi:GNAT superfamily N-acetyltransferase
VRARLRKELASPESFQRAFSFSPPGSSSAGGQFWVAEVDAEGGGSEKKIIGCVGVCFHVSQGDAAEAELKYLCVDAAYRKRRIGYDLCQRVLAYSVMYSCQCRHVTHITLSTLHFLVDAIALYERCGFKQKASCQDDAARAEDNAHSRYSDSGISILTYAYPIPEASDSECRRMGRDAVQTMEEEFRRLVAIGASKMVELPPHPVGTIASGVANSSGGSRGDMPGTIKGGRGTGSPVFSSSETTAAISKHQPKALDVSNTKKDVDQDLPTWKTGSVLRLTHVVSGATLDVAIEQDKARPRLLVRLAQAQAPYTRLQVQPNGDVVWGERAGRNAMFAIDDVDILGLSDLPSDFNTLDHTRKMGGLVRLRPTMNNSRSFPALPVFSCILPFNSSAMLTLFFILPLILSIVSSCLSSFLLLLLLAASRRRKNRKQNRRNLRRKRVLLMTRRRCIKI